MRNSPLDYRNVDKFHDLLNHGNNTNLFSKTYELGLRPKASNDSGALIKEVEREKETKVKEKAMMGHHQGKRQEEVQEKGETAKANQKATVTVSKGVRKRTKN